MLESEIIKSIPVEETDAVLLGVPYEGTVSRGRGASAGPGAIVDMLRYQVELYDYILGEIVCDKVKIAEKNLPAKNILPEKLAPAVKSEVAAILDLGKFPVTLGGEHSVSLGPISASRDKFQNLTVVQIDAHADLREDNRDYEPDPKKFSRYAHSCVMRRAHELGCQLVQIGIRSLAPTEAEFIRKEKMETNIFFTPIKDSYEKIISRCQSENIYLTIDVDGFDPAVMPATGTPEPGGLSWDWGLGFFKELFAKKNVVGLDIVEVAPRKGETLTEFAAAKLLYHLIGLKFLG